MFRRTFSRLLAAALIVSTQGCTFLIWRPACEDRAVQPQLAGVVRNFPNPGDRALIVRYKAIGDGTDVDLVVPLSADFKPLPPFAAPADLSIVRFDDEVAPDDNIAGGLTQAQLTIIRSKAGTIGVDRAELAKHLNSHDFTPVSVQYIGIRGDGTPQHPDTATVLAFRINAAGEVMPIAFDPGKDAHPKIHLSPGDRVLLVPTTVARPPGDQGRDRVVAVALTPLTLAGDTALVGVGIGVCMVIVGAIIVASPVLIIMAAADKSHPAAAQTQPVEPPAPTATRTTGPATTEIPILMDGPTTRP